MSIGKIVTVALVAGLLWPACALAGELVMFERAGCPWCQRWDREVGALYAKTSEAKRLPLRRVDIHSGSTGGIVLASPVRYTPTFVVVDEGREIGRIIGYINDETFWGLLSALAAKLKPARDASVPNPKFTMLRSTLGADFGFDQDASKLNDSGVVYGFRNSLDELAATMERISEPRH